MFDLVIWSLIVIADGVAGKVGSLDEHFLSCIENLVDHLNLTEIVNHDLAHTGRSRQSKPRGGLWSLSQLKQLKGRFRNGTATLSLLGDCLLYTLTTW